jgi:hypothetical protein
MLARFFSLDLPLYLKLNSFTLPRIFETNRECADASLTRLCTAIATRLAGHCDGPICERFSAWLPAGSNSIASTLSEKGTHNGPVSFEYSFATYIIVRFS